MCLLNEHLLLCLTQGGISGWRLPPSGSVMSRVSGPIPVSNPPTSTSLPPDFAHAYPWSSLTSSIPSIMANPCPTVANPIGINVFPQEDAVIQYRVVLDAPTSIDNSKSSLPATPFRLQPISICALPEDSVLHEGGDCFRHGILSIREWRPSMRRMGIHRAHVYRAHPYAGLADPQPSTVNEVASQI